MSLIYIVLSFCLEIFLIFPARAQAQARWGHLDHFEERKPAFLSTAARREHLIRFCIDNTMREKFNDVSLAIETRMAINLWLAASSPYVGNVSVEQTECSQGLHNLQVFIGNKLLVPVASSYVDFIRDHGHLISRIIIDTKFKEKYGNVSYSTVDFASFFKNDSDMEKFAKLAERNRWNHHDAARVLNVPYGQVYNSTYHEMIHEVGHTFGLCDTFKFGTLGNCDLAHTSATQPAEAVMKTANLFYLTDDDLLGIKKIYERIR